MICFSAVAAENTNSPTSLQEFSKQARESYEKKDGDWILKHTDTNGVPAEIAAAQGEFLKSFWGSENLVLTSVETFRFDDYKPKTFPEEFHGRKLRFVGKPTHWIVLRTAPPQAQIW